MFGSTRLFSHLGSLYEVLLQSSGITPVNNYVTENGLNAYVTENGSNNYVPAQLGGQFLGDLNTNITSIDVSGGIQISRSSGNLPAFVQVSASLISAAGSVLDVQGNATGGALRPYE